MDSPKDNKMNIILILVEPEPELHCDAALADPTPDPLFDKERLLKLQGLKQYLIFSCVCIYSKLRQKKTEENTVVC
jgi:hypothetical protein